MVTTISRAAHEQQPQGSRQQRSVYRHHHHHHHHTVEYRAIRLCSTPLLHLPPSGYTSSSSVVNFFTPPPTDILFIQLLCFALCHIYFIHAFIFGLLAIPMASIHGPLSEACCCYGPALPSLSSACPLQPARACADKSSLCPFLGRGCWCTKTLPQSRFAQPVGPSEPGSMSDHG